MINTLFGNKIDMAIDRLKFFEDQTDGKGFYLAFSGGKDSCVIKALADMAGVKYDAHYNLTTMDPPELLYFIRDNHSDVEWHRPEQTFLQKVQTKGMPTRQGRWCCEYLKEGAGGDRFVMLGVRWAESVRRSKRRMVESCYREEGRRYLNPIIDWTEEDVWQFIRFHEIPYCKLYDEGFKRLGCLFCPMASPTMKRMQVERYPRFAAAFVRAFQKLRDNRKAKGLTSCDKWANGQEMFDWWISNTSSKIDDGGLFD